MKSSILIMIHTPPCTTSLRYPKRIKEIAKHKLVIPIEVIQLLHKQNKKILGFCSTRSNGKVTAEYLYKETGVYFYEMKELECGMFAEHTAETTSGMIKDIVDVAKKDVAVIITNQGYCLDIPLFYTKGRPDRDYILRNLPVSTCSGSMIMIDLNDGVVIQS